MEESTILRIAWICAIFGMSGLGLYYLLSDSDDTTLSFSGNAVVVEGIVKSVGYSKDSKTSFLTLKQDDIFMVAFEHLNLSKGDTIAARGTLNNYNGKKELVVERIVKR